MASTWSVGIAATKIKVLEVQISGVIYEYWKPFFIKKTYYTRLNRHIESLFLIHFKFLHYLQLIFILSRYIYKQMHFIIYIDKITISSRFGCHSKVWWSMQNILGKEWLRLFRFCDLSRNFHVKSLSNWWHCSEIVFFVL